MTTFNEYEQFVIREMAKNAISTNPVQVALEVAGKPVAKLMEVAHSSKNKYIKKAVSNIDATIEKSLRGTVKLAKKLTSDDAVRKEFMKNHKLSINHIEEIRNLSLKEMDIVADSFDASNGFFVTAEGATMGLITTFTAGLLAPVTIAADVTASMTLMSRHISQIATSYGYSPVDPMNMPHILAAMAPTSSSSDEGFLSAKSLAFAEITAATKFANAVTKEWTSEVIEKSCPSLIKLIQKVAERLGVVITQKELGMIVPIAGAVINGGLNLAFQQMNHTNAKDYFRKVYLYNKYGEDIVNNALAGEIQRLESRVS
ncbi:EcsC family protein [Paenibacillus sp. PL91]|uniref:EcsC family protein n=1 Tax=Paenibacillus sp. PL91 TaxID=2729538 RepID=UPI00145D849A|nr:EcsC family protein [Paenibacillus sp. PL91]MBC9199798.1 EcsC family protein [Paenibacillus sp. PL91]